MNRIETPKKRSFWEFLTRTKREPEVAVPPKEAAIRGLVNILTQAIDQGIIEGHDGLMVVKFGIKKFTKEVERQIENGTFKDLEEIKTDRRIKKALRLVHNFYTANKVTDQKVRDTLESLGGGIFE